MSNQNKKQFKFNWKILIVVLLIGFSLSLLIAAIFIGKIWGIDNGFTINSAQDFIEAINHSDRAKEQYNYFLTKSIEVDIAEIPSEKSFYGNLNGEGNTITLISSEELPLTHPIFSKIQNGAVIEHLEIVANVVLGADEDASDIALLANDNFGIVKNCLLSIQSVYIGNKCCNAAALINNNFGEISSVCLDVEEIDSSQTKDTWQCDFGAISTRNYATVRNVYAKIVFNALDIFNDKYDNINVGYLFGRVGNNVEVNSSVSEIYLFEDKFWAFSVDKYWFGESVIRKSADDWESEISKFR